MKARDALSTSNLVMIAAAIGFLGGLWLKEREVATLCKQAGVFIVHKQEVIVCKLVETEQ